MKSSLWKFILVFGAVLVGAALVVPKAFRDKPEKTAEQITVTAQNVSPDEAVLDNVKPVTFGFHEVKTASIDVINQCVQDQMCPPGTKAYLSETQEYILLADRPILSAADVKKVSVGLNQRTNAPIVNYTFNSVGAGKFCDFTTKHMGAPVAVILNGEIISMPTIFSPICGASGYIEGNFTVKEAKDLALALNAGTTPVKQRVVD